MCEALNLSYTELLKQPAEWVQSSIEYLGIKSDYDKAQIDKDS